MDQQPFDHEVAIIGTGFSGMGAAIALDRAGFSDFILLEKDSEPGGTWRDNRYPGACCDVPSQLYSYSFELNPGWTRRFSPAREIWGYELHVLEKYGLRPRTRCNFEVSEASWDNAGWTVTSRAGERLRVRYLISAIGALHIPHKPALPGLETFGGKVMHSAEWDHDYDCRDKDIIVVGSAASAVQIIPAIAKTAHRVTVMQRTPNWFFPRKDRKISGFEHWLFRTFPFIQRLARWRQYCFNDFLVYPNFLTKPSVPKRYVQWLARRHLQRGVADPELLATLTPDYEIGCKRILLTDDYLPAVQRDNVDLLTEGIGHFSEKGLVTADGRTVPADCVILATGFEVQKLFGDMTVRGPGGLTLDDAWSDEIRSHRSVAVCGFPNFFMMFGPNSGLGHSSIIIMIEAQAKYLARLIGHAQEVGRPVISARPEAEAAWNEAIQRDLKNTVWATGCKSWYKDERGHIFSLWPHSTTRFIREMARAPLDEYDFLPAGPEADQENLRTAA
jgi:cation diffusion facilitator CzcD-associated flavoprotein CzcO